MSGNGLRMKEYWHLIKLARRRKHSPEVYFHFERYQADLLMRYLAQHQVDLQGKKVLDLGCGSGGYLEGLQATGANAIGLDLPRMALREGFNKVAGNALQLPLAGGVFDAVLCINLIEHVTDQVALLHQMARVVKPGGFIYLGFPPFYALNGGHSLAPFHYLGEKAAVRILNWKRRKRVQTGRWGNKRRVVVTGYSNLFAEYGLTLTTVSHMDWMISQTGLEVLERSTKYSPINLSGIPVLREVLNWHVQYLLRV